MMPCDGLINRWRAAADDLRRYGAESQATALEACAAELECEQRAYAVEELTLEQAAVELGVTCDTVGRRVARDEIPNVGRKHRPRVRRCDLKEKVPPMGPRLMTDHSEPDLAALLLRDSA